MLNLFQFMLIQADVHVGDGFDFVPAGAKTGRMFGRLCLQLFDDVEQHRNGHLFRKWAKAQFREVFVSNLETAGFRVHPDGEAYLDGVGDRDGIPEVQVLQQFCQVMKSEQLLFGSHRTFTSVTAGCCRL